MNAQLKKIELAEKFLHPYSQQNIYKITVYEALRLVDGKYGSIFAYSHGKMKRVYTSNKDLLAIAPRKNGTTIKVYKSKMPVVRTIQDVIEILPSSRKIYDKLQVRYDINVPLTYNKKVLGVLSILGEHKFNQNDISTLEVLSPLATLAIQESLIREKLEKALQARDFFLSVASHELKTPLTSVCLYADMLGKVKDAEQEKLVQKNLLLQSKD